MKTKCKNQQLTGQGSEIIWEKIFGEDLVWLSSLKPKAGCRVRLTVPTNPLMIGKDLNLLNPVGQAVTLLMDAFGSQRPLFFMLLFGVCGEWR